MLYRSKFAALIISFMLELSDTKQWDRLPGLDNEEELFSDLSS